MNRTRNKRRYEIKLWEHVADEGYEFSVFVSSIKEACKERTHMARGNDLPSCEVSIFDHVSGVYK